MAVIFHEGLTNGERLRLCSDTARLWFPYLFTASNGLGRLEVNYTKNILIYGMEAPPSEARFEKLLLEFQGNFLLFLYSHPGTATTWGQWWAKENSLPAHKSKSDLVSPGPPAEAYQSWQAEYAEQKRQGAARAFGNLPPSDGSSRAQETPMALTMAILEACRAAGFLATDEAMASRIAMVGLAVQPGWKPSEVAVPMRLAGFRGQQSPAGYLGRLPNVLRALANRPAQRSLFVPEEGPATIGIPEEQMAELDRVRASDGHQAAEALWSQFRAGCG